MLVTAAQDLRRLRQILGILVNYGYGEWARRPALELGVDAKESPPTELSGPKRFRALLEELGSTFIKLGQVLSARPDLVSREYIEELKQLQYQCEPLPFAEIEVALQEGLGGDPRALFEWIDEKPLATASIAQVHRARTKEGVDVAVKVQRPGVRAMMRADIDIMHRIARFLDAVIEESSITDAAGIVHEFDKALSAELNFAIEAANSREFRRTHAGRDDVVVPAVHDRLSSDTVLTLDFLRGVPFTNLPPDADRRAIAERTVREAFDEVFIDGFFHGDPHPGNLLLLEDGRYGILDFGLCGRLTAQMRETLVVLALAVAVRDADTAARTLYRLGQSDARVDIAALRSDLTTLFDKWLGRQIRDVDSTVLVQELLLLALKHRIRVPPEYTMLGRAGATIEGIVREFGPDLDVAKVAGPYLERLLLGRVGPENVQGSLYKALLQFQGLSEDVPLQISQILADLSAGNLAVSVGGAQIERLRSTIATAATTIAGSILTAAFVIGTFFAASRVEWTLLGVPVVAIFGTIAAATVFSWTSAYAVLRPRLRKLRVSGLFKKRS